MMVVPFHSSPRVLYCAVSVTGTTGSGSTL
jgi:hypothetical protein